MTSFRERRDSMTEGQLRTARGILVVVAVLVAVVLGGIFAYQQATHEVYRIPEGSVGLVTRGAVSVSSRGALFNRSTSVVGLLEPGDHVHDNSGEISLFTPGPQRTEFEVRVVKGPLQRTADNVKNIVVSNLVLGPVVDGIKVRPLIASGVIEYEIGMDDFKSFAVPKKPFELEIQLVELLVEAIRPEFKHADDLARLSKEVTKNLSTSGADSKLKNVRVTFSEAKIFENDQSEEAKIRSHALARIKGEPVGSTVLLGELIVYFVVGFVLILGLIVVALTCPEILLFFGSMGG